MGAGQGAVVGIVIVATAGCLGIVASAVSQVSQTDDAFSLFTSLVLGAVTAWFLIARCSFSGARPESVGLRVRNPLRTSLLPWIDIVRVRIGAHGLWPRVAVVDLRDGSEIHIWGLQGPLAFFRPKSRWKLDAAVAGLQRAVLESQSLSQSIDAPRHEGWGIEKSYPTPEEAALAGFPVGLARVVRVRAGARSAECAVALGDDEVEVELATNEPPYEYTYFVHVARHDGKWFEGVSHN